MSPRTAPRPTVSSTGAHEVVVKDERGQIIATVIREGASHWTARYRNGSGPFRFFGGYDTKPQAIESVWSHHLLVLAEEAEITAASGPSGPRRIEGDNTGFRMTPDGMIFHHGMFIGRIVHNETFEPGEGSPYAPQRGYVAQGIEIPSGDTTEYRSIGSRTAERLTRAQVIEIEVANR